MPLPGNEPETLARKLCHTFFLSWVVLRKLCERSKRDFQNLENYLKHFMPNSKLALGLLTAHDKLV